MKRLNFLMLILIVPGLSPYASEMKHTAYTWFCPDARIAHGICRTEHSDCGIDCASLDFNCYLQRNGETRDWDKEEYTKLASAGKFVGLELQAALVGSGRANYCTYNNSKYRNLLGQKVRGQQSAQDCRHYRASDGPGGGDEP